MVLLTLRVLLNYQKRLKMRRRYKDDDGGRRKTNSWRTCKQLQKSKSLTRKYCIRDFLEQG